MIDSVLYYTQTIFLTCTLSLCDIFRVNIRWKSWRHPPSPRPSNMGEPGKFHKIWKKRRRWTVFVFMGGVHSTWWKYSTPYTLWFIKFGKWFYQLGHVDFFENILVCKWHIIIFTSLLRPYLNLEDCVELIFQNVKKFVLKR